MLWIDSVPSLRYQSAKITANTTAHSNVVPVYGMPPNRCRASDTPPGVTTHQAYGLGSYCYFNVNKSVVADHAFETPTGSGIGFHDILTVSLGGVGVIEYVVNETGGATPSNTTPVDVVSYP